MTVPPRLIVLLVLLFFQMACTSVVEDSEPQRTKLDPGILTASFSNGFKYYLRSANSVPDNEQIEIRLVVKAGSLHETKSQSGYAHLLEHMAYRGTRSFTNQDIEGLLEKAGLQWGVDVNATTHYGATVYRFSLHHDDAYLLPKVFSLMSEWLSAMKIDPVSLEREKRIVEAEWRERYAKRNYVVDPLTRLAFTGSRYDSKPPVGDLGNIRQVTEESLNQFRELNYRPDNAVLIVTGSKEPWNLEPLIKRYFSVVKKKEAVENTKLDYEKFVAGVKNYSHTVTEQAEFISYVNPEKQLSELAINFISPIPESSASESKPEGLVAAKFNEQLLFSAYSHLLRNRLLTTVQCSSLVTETSLLESGQTIKHIKITLLQEDILDCVSIASKAVKRVSSMQLTDEEFEKFHRLFSDIAADTVARYRNRTSADIADDLVDMVVNDEISMPVWRLQKELKAVVSTIDRNRLDAMIKGVSNSYRLVYSAVSNRDLVTTENMVAAAGRSGVLSKRRTPPRLVSGSYKPEQENYAVPDFPVDEKSVVKIAEGDGFHQWRLKNGATAILIEDDSADQIALAAVSNGGYSGVNHLQSFAAKNLPRFIQVNGVNGFVSSSLKIIERDRLVAVDPFVDQFSHGIYGNSHSDELPLLISLIESFFQEPMVVEPKSSALVNRLSELRSDDWHQLYWNDQGSLASNSQLFRSKSKLTTDVFQQAHRDLFNTPADFGFIFYGSVDASELQHQLQRLSYGVKPSGAQVHVLSDSRVRNLSLVNHGLSATELAFYVACPVIADSDSTQFRQWSLLSDILANRLRFSIRENHGLSYEVESDALSYRTQQAGSYYMNLTRFVVSPENAGVAASVARQVLAQVQSSGVTNSELQWALARENRNKLQRSRSFLYRAGEMADEWLATGTIALRKASVELAAINRVARCIDINGGQTVVLKSIDRRNVETAQMNEGEKSQSALHEKPSGRVLAD